MRHLTLRVPLLSSQEWFTRDGEGELDGPLSWHFVIFTDLVMPRGDDVTVDVPTWNSCC